MKYKHNHKKDYNYLFLIIFLVVVCFNPLVIVNAGERGVLLEFGKVKEQILYEGIHVVIPLVNTVKKINVRIQKQELNPQASSKDLQDIFTQVAVNWHILPEKVNLVFQTVGLETEVVTTILNPAVQEVLKAVIARYTAEEVITKREEVKDAVDKLLKSRLNTYHIQVYDISLVNISFSPQFIAAVEAKQIAEQEAKKTGFMVIKASKEAEVKINIARGEAEAQRIVKETLTPEILKKYAIDKWDGKLPIVISDDNWNMLDIDSLSSQPLASSQNTATTSK